MLNSRGLSLFRALKQASKLQQVRNSHGVMYRLPGPPPPRRNIIAAEIISGVAWWWILWHLWHEHEHITGEFAYPDPSKWTDAELGIPPDDEDV